MNESLHSDAGFTIKTEIARSRLSLPKDISDRITILTFEIVHNTRAKLFSCYAPTMVVAKVSSKRMNFTTDAAVSSPVVTTRINIALWAFYRLCWH